MKAAQPSQRFQIGDVVMVVDRGFYRLQEHNRFGCWGVISGCFSDGCYVDYVDWNGRYCTAWWHPNYELRSLCTDVGKLTGAVGQSLAKREKIVCNFADPNEMYCRWIEDIKGRPLGKIVKVDFYQQTATLRLRPWEGEDGPTITRPFELYTPDWQERLEGYERTNKKKERTAT